MTTIAIDTRGFIPIKKPYFFKIKRAIKMLNLGHIGDKLMRVNCKSGIKNPICFLSLFCHNIHY
jgi:hypothetical protein